MRSLFLPVTVLALSSTLVGCGEPDSGTGAGSGDASSSTATPATDSSGTPEPASTSAEATTQGSGADSSGGSDSSGGPPPLGGEPGTVRFVAFGDTGEGNEAQQMVANAAEVICEERGCDFALLLGDNFYDTGVTSVTDQQFVDKFEVVYEGLDMPFYVVLGNHDYGLLSNDWSRGNYQVEYSTFNEKWNLPHYWYTFTSPSGGTQFFAFDTARMMWNHDVEDQRAWIASELAASTSPWRIAIAHHPYISNGKHGNAGNYDGGFLPILQGDEVKAFIDDFICDVAQVYISGHDHNRQAFDPVCGTYFLVSGASAKTEDFVFRDDNPTQWGDDQREGFLWVQIEGAELVAAFYDLDANLDHELTVSL